jgi:hypothetical protein
VNDEDRLDALLLEWEERFERGEDVPAAELCPDRPDLASVLAGRIADLRRMAWTSRPEPGDDDPPAADDPPTEPLVGRYELKELIGEGGFGRVYRGRDRKLGRQVAIKLPRFGGHAGGAGKAFEAEASRVAGLDCPGIVRVYDVNRHGDVTFIVSELIDGIDLARRLRDGPVPVREAVRVVADAAGYLHAAHQRGFVHRDIKPANLLLDRAGRVFVTDFGIAVTRDELAARGADGSGTLPYMSPEQLHRDPDRIDARTDVYSLGVVMYELLAGHRPFRADTPEGLREAVLGREPPPLRASNRAVGWELERICSRCLAKSPANRYPTAEALADDLSRWLTRRSKFRRLVRLAAVAGVSGLLTLGAVKMGTRPVPPAAPVAAPAAPELGPADGAFDGTGRTGWAVFGPQPEPPGAVRVEGGALVLRKVKDRPYRLCTDGTFRDFDLRFEYCYPADRAARDAGCSVLLRVADPAKPAGAHAQVKFGDWTAGYVVHPGLRLGDESEIDPLPAAVGAERPFGQWNEMALTCAGGAAEVWINDRKINREDGLPEHEGRIGFSCPECDEVRVRNIRVRRRGQ